MKVSWMQISCYKNSIHGESYYGNTDAYMATYCAIYIMFVRTYYHF